MQRHPVFSELGCTQSKWFSEKKKKTECNFSLFSDRSWVEERHARMQHTSTEYLFKYHFLFRAAETWGQERNMHLSLVTKVKPHTWLFLTPRLSLVLPIKVNQSVFTEHHETKTPSAAAIRSVWLTATQFDLVPFLRPLSSQRLGEFPKS